LKYLEVVDRYGKEAVKKAPAARAIGGIIGPY
jgi:hypothetical protein